MEVVMDLDVRLARQAFLDKHHPAKRN